MTAVNAFEMLGSAPSLIASQYMPASCSNGADRYAPHSHNSFRTH
jgi:hypothetical protein